MSLTRGGMSDAPLAERTTPRSTPALHRRPDFGSKSENWWNLSDHVPTKENETEHEEWDRSDSLVHISPNDYLGQVSKMPNKKKTFKKEDIDSWINKDTNNGFIVLHPPDIHSTDGDLIPCTLAGTVEVICLQNGLYNNSLHVQYSGDVIRRLEAECHPLVLQNEYLSSIGYTDMSRIQREGASMELGNMIKFFSGKPFVDYTYVKNSMASVLLVRKGKVFHQWTERLCVLSGTQLFVYRDRTKRSKPTIVQLCKGSVQLVRFKDHDYALKIISTANDKRGFYLAMKTEEEFIKWLKRFRKATSKLPTATDLSNCHLEYMPDTVFTNTDIKALNLRRNCMKERPPDDLMTTGWIEDINRFTSLRSLNLSDNDLGYFPVSLCNIITLVELNVSTNRIQELPVEIGLMKNLEVLHLHNNRLSYVPDDLATLPSLHYVILAFNKFSSIPQTLIQLSEVEGRKMTTVVMSGNDVERIENEVLGRMKNITRLSLQMNKLTLRPTETVKFSLMERLTYLDIRQNKVKDLDIRCVRTLEYLNCERNQMATLQINGTHLKFLRAAHNHLSSLVINPKPEWLEHFDISHNRLSSLPDYLSSCFFLKTLLANHNKLRVIPDRLLCDASALKILSLNHNHLTELPEEIARFTVEELYLHRNQLEHIPPHLLEKSNKLRILNVSRNKLSHLPSPHEFEDHNKLQELYVSHNRLRDDVMDVIGQYPRLKVLHIAYNKLQEICERSLARLEGIRELNISGNRLTSLPGCLLELKYLTMLRAHSNLLKHLPNFEMLESLKILDVGSNQLHDISVRSLVDSHLNLLDMSMNNDLSISTEDIMTLKHKKDVNFVDITGMNRSLPGTPLTNDRKSLDAFKQPWKLGLAETSGSRNRLCITILKNLALDMYRGHVFGMFDGGFNDEVPKLLEMSVPDCVKREFRYSPGTAALNLKYALLSAHKNLGVTGQKLGAASALVHLHRVRGDTYNLTVANAGDVEAVLSRNNEVILLTRSFTVNEDREEMERIRSGDGLITEDSRVYGSSRCTRTLGNSYLHPYVIPDPHVCTLSLGAEDRFIIIANRCLWTYLTYQEAVLEVLQIHHPVLAAKKLQDVAQAYGCKENLSILVIYLSIGRGDDATREISIYDDQFYLQESSDEEEGSVVVSEGQRTPDGTVRLKPLGAKRYLKKKKAGEWGDALQRRLVDTVKERELQNSVETIKPTHVERLKADAGEWRLSSAETKRRFLPSHQAAAHMSKMEMNGTAEIGEIEYPMEYELGQDCVHEKRHSSSEESLASTLCDGDGEYRKADSYLNSLLNDPTGELTANGHVYELEEQEIFMLLSDEEDENGVEGHNFVEEISVF